MRIRAYDGKPAIWSPDPGEIIYARRSDMDKFVLAVVEKAWRNRAGHLRLRLMWLEEDPDASPGESDRSDRDNDPGVRVTGKGDTRPIAPLTVGWTTIRGPVSESPLIKQVDRDSLPRQVVSRKSPSVA